MKLLTPISRNRVDVHAQNKEMDFTCSICGEISCINILGPKNSREDAAFLTLVRRREDSKIDLTAIRLRMWKRY